MHLNLQTWLTKLLNIIKLVSFITFNFGSSVTYWSKYNVLITSYNYHNLKQVLQGIWDYAFRIK